MGDGPNRGGASRRWIIAEVENSLRRLGTDWIDLYQMHRPDPETDIDETLGALTDLVQQGKVRYIGSSSFSGGEIVEAQWVARERNLQRFRTEQPPYSLLVRGIELDVLPTAQRHGMGILTYSPLAGGWLSGSWTADSSPTSPARQRLVARFDMSLPENQRKLEAVEAAREGRRRSRHVDDRARDRVRRQPPGGDVGDHRAAHDGAAREPAARRRRRARRRRCSTASTRSSAPASTSTRPTPATASRCSRRRCGGGSPSRRSWGRRPPVSGYFASSAMVLSKLPTRPGKSNSGNWESDSTGKWSS